MFIFRKWYQLFVVKLPTCYFAFFLFSRWLAHRFKSRFIVTSYLGYFVYNFFFLVRLNCSSLLLCVCNFNQLISLSKWCKLWRMKNSWIANFLFHCNKTATVQNYTEETLHFYNSIKSFLISCANPLSNGWQAEKERDAQWRLFWARGREGGGGGGERNHHATNHQAQFGVRFYYKILCRSQGTAHSIQIIFGWWCVFFSHFGSVFDAAARVIDAKDSSLDVWRWGLVVPIEMCVCTAEKA